MTTRGECQVAGCERLVDQPDQEWCWRHWAASSRPRDAMREALEVVTARPALGWEPLPRPEDWPHDSFDARLAYDEKGNPYNAIAEGNPHAFCVLGYWCEDCELRVDERLENEAFAEGAGW